MHGFRQKNDKIDLRLPKREAQTSYVIDFTGNNFLALKPRRSQEIAEVGKGFPALLGVKKSPPPEKTGRADRS